MNQRNKFRGLYELNRQHKSSDSSVKMADSSEKQGLNDDSLEEIVQQFNAHD
jgi:hypothetical protein